MISIYFEFLIPFILAALVVIGITILAERYGTKTGGVIGTLPSTILVAYIFIAYNEGIPTASQSVAVVPAEMGVNIIFLLLFALYSHRSLPITLCISFGSWILLSALLFVFNVDNIFLSVGIFFTLYAFSMILLEGIKKTSSITKTSKPQSSVKILSRGILAGLVIAIAVLLSNLGAVLSGIFSAFPVIFLSTMIIAMRNHGQKFTEGIAKSMILGSPSVVSYATSIFFLYPLYGIISGTILAFFMSLLVTITIFLLGKKIR